MTSKNMGLTQIAQAAPSVAYAVGRLDRLISQQLTEALAEYDVSLPQFTMLSNLHRRGATANAALAARSFVTPQAANQVVNVMVRNGWVFKRSDPNHGRMLLIELTEEGRRLYGECAAAAAVVEQKMLDGLTPETVIMLKATLRRLLDNLHG